MGSVRCFPHLHSLLLPAGIHPVFCIPANYEAVRSYTPVARLPVLSAHRSGCGTSARSGIRRVACRGSSPHARSASAFPAGCAPARSSAPRPSPASAANRTPARYPHADSPASHALRSRPPARASHDRCPDSRLLPVPTHSRVYASTTLRMRTMRPFASPSTMKSIAHS